MKRFNFYLGRGFRSFNFSVEFKRAFAFNSMCHSKVAIVVVKNQVELFQTLCISTRDSVDFNYKGPVTELL